jgi:REP element-mobilizing transposase RayT
MGRPHRAAQGGYVYHVLNRANARMRIFDDEAGYDAFERVLLEAVERTQTRLLAYCLMPNHWHLIVWPRKDDELSRFVGWLTLTHTQRWHAHRRTTGSGHLYQGRFKSFPVQEDEHFYTVARYRTTRRSLETLMYGQSCVLVRAKSHATTECHSLRLFLPNAVFASSNSTRSNVTEKGAISFKVVPS